jgi:thiol-disulfide isomerase/thioredoxin
MTGHARTPRRLPFRFCLMLAFVAGLALVASCSSTPSLKLIFSPANVTLDTLGPNFLHNVSQIKYWDRMSTVMRATNFAWWDSTGHVREMNEFYDKVVVLTFFGTWSPPALAQLPVIDSVRGDTNALFIGVTMREGVTNGKAVTRIDSFVQAHNIPYQVLIGSRDFGFTYGGIDEVPATFVITRKRKIAASFDGFVPAAKLRDAIERAEQKP